MAIYLTGFTDPTTLAIIYTIAVIPFIIAFFVLRLIVKENNIFKNLRDKNSSNRRINAVIYNLILIIGSVLIVCLLLFGTEFLINNLK